jgi:hypothetical protein
MSQMQVPVTDAFDDTDQLRSLDVELTPRQIKWLKTKAEEQGLSLDHMLRSVITAQIRGTETTSGAPARSGDGVPRTTDVDPAPEVDRDVVADAEEAPAGGEEDDSSSIVDSLRSASERLQDLTDDDGEAEQPASDLRDTLSRLQAHGDAPSDDGPSAEEAGGPDVVVEDQGRSMFDMVEDGE